MVGSLPSDAAIHNAYAITQAYGGRGLPFLSFWRISEVHLVLVPFRGDGLNQNANKLASS
jgi:hypothetical protein